MILLNLANAKIEEIAQYAFEKNKKLQELDIANNLLTEIPRLFKSTDNELQILSCEDNKLKSLKTLGLSNLQHLNLARNQITNSELTSILKPTTRISYLDFELLANYLFLTAIINFYDRTRSKILK